MAHHYEDDYIPTEYDKQAKINEHFKKMNAKEILTPTEWLYRQEYKPGFIRQELLDAMLEYAKYYASLLKPDVSWIKTKDRLPKQYDIILTFGHPNDGGVGLTICTHSDGIFRFWESEKENKHTITHWAELPDTPKIKH